MRVGNFLRLFLSYSLVILSTQTFPAELILSPLSREAQISLITGEPGQELYTRFGHSAIRIYDRGQGIDLVYNYGTFDFDAPGFYTNFMRGKLKYFLSVYDFEYMARSYSYNNQSLFEQILNLTYDEKISVYAYLNNNYKPENRYYLYDFFYDNCSSRIKDVFQEILGPELVFDDSHIHEHKTFRQLLDEFLHKDPWGDFGIDLLLGIPTDKIASSEEYMFLPYKLYDAFNNARIIRNGKNVSFVQAASIIHQSVPIADSKFHLTPATLFWSLLFVILFISLALKRRGIIQKSVDTVLFTVSGLTGIIIFLLWFATDHTATRDNLNILWAFPGHILLPYFIIKSAQPRILKYYCLFWSIFLLLLLGSWALLPQQLNNANIPLILMLIIRFYHNHKQLKSHVERRGQ